MWGVFLNLFYCLCRLCSSNSLDMERNDPTHLEGPSSGASSSSTSPPVGDYEGRTQNMEGNDHEVFLSFRGKDTRKGFTDHLYTNLVHACIRVFRDDEELRVGEEIGPELLCSITQSKISIPIISENYASSKWCLWELAHMLKRKRDGEQIVLPIFYKVEPSQLRNAMGTFRDAINAHKKKLGQIVGKEWEEALKEVSFLKGWNSEKDENGHEGALVNTIVRKVMGELKRLLQLKVPEQLVGIDDQVEQIMSRIDANFVGPWIIGIYGMGGIGKTTLAKVIYNKLSSHFKDCSFVANIRETSHCKDIMFLQNQLISDILGKFDVSNVDEGIHFIKSRFTSKKILILLDDMDDIAHVNALVGDHSWFKAGSIVIITTRNKWILEKAKANHMYPLNELPLDKSLILFSRHAFRKDFPQSDYEVISNAIVSTTGGLPLALEIIGSFLCGRTKNLWKDTLKQLQQVPERKVQEKLRISYDALEYEAQQIFLDIACFFTNSSKESPTYMWDACGFFPEKEIEVLGLMSLIKIDEHGHLMMHDQLRDVGREIVRLENQREPQKRSRLWNTQEAEDVINNNEGTSKIEGLDISMNNWTQTYTAENFKKLTNLRFLRVNKVILTGDFQSLLLLLRWLQCTNCWLEFEVDNFHLKNLIVLDFSLSKISENWRGWGQLKIATELKVLNLEGCALRTTPNLSPFKSLKVLILANNMDLEEIHISIQNIKNLVSLNVRNCSKLKKLPLGVGRMEELRELLIYDTGIQEIPISRGYLTKLETLNASYCELTRLPDSLGSLVSLQSLFLSGCYLLREIPNSIGELVSLTELHLEDTAIEELPESIGYMKELKTLNASNCASLAHIPSSIGHLASLSLLDVTGCNKLAQLPDCICSFFFLQRLFGCRSLREIPHSIKKLESLSELHLYHITLKDLPEFIGSLKELKTLDASYCASLARLPSSIGHLASLSLLDLTGCDELAQLPDSIGSLVSLQCLLLSRCCSLREIPNSIGKLESLIELHLESTNVEELPKSICFLKELKTLNASNCASLVRIPSSIGHLTSLSLLDLTGCNKLAQLPDSIGSLVSLQRLLLLGCHSLREIPDSIGNLESLIDLHLEYTALEELPESIGFLKELKTLNASYCVSLACIPSSIGHLASLSLLDLTGCDKLAQLPVSIGSLVSLHCLLLSGCHSLREIPDSFRKLTSLTEMHLISTEILELPESIRNMQNLRILDISQTPVVNLLGDSTLMAELQELRAVGRRNLERLPSNTGELVLLKKLDLDKFPKLSKLCSYLLALDLLKHPKTPANNSAMDYQTIDSEHVLKRSRPFGILDEDSERMADGKPRIADDSGDKSRNWKLAEINDLLQCRSIKLPDNTTATRVSRLIYTNSGCAILALSSNAVHKLWKWQRSDRNLTGRATTSVLPCLWQPPGLKLMTNDTTDINPEDTVSCFTLSKNDCYVMSASGGNISLFNMKTFEVMKTFMPPLPYGDIIAIKMDDSCIQIYSVQEDEVKIKLKGHRRIIKGFSFPTPLTVLMSFGTDSQTMTTLVPSSQAATFLAFYPQDNNIIAIGMEDSSIQIYNVRVDEFKAILRGHRRRITGLAFSNVLNVLVSSAADSQLCVWSTDGWEKQASKFLQMPNGRGAAPFADTGVQFHVDQIDLLVVHQTQIATCEAPKLERLKQWDTREASAPITNATYSCNGQSIYVSFEDGSVGVLTASILRLRCRINPATYINPNRSFRVYPLVIAAHPSEPNQFALGLTDGSVYVFEPSESEGKWGTFPPVENGTGLSTTSGATSLDQPQR